MHSKEPNISNIDISIIITIFNKEQQISYTLSSILKQIDGLSYEFILVNDNSTDQSMNVVKKTLQDYINITIINNEHNLGPSISLNKGCMAASGKYLLLIDGDDILANNALLVMLRAIKKESADFVFGFNKITNSTLHELSKITIPSNVTYKVSDTPLDTILKGKYVRMSYLIDREIFLKSGGADTRVFIQDESLPIRLAYHSKRMISLDSPAIYSTRKNNSLSENKLQQLHDRFYAYYFALSDLKSINSHQKAKIYQRIISTIWKAKKMTANSIDKIYFLTFYCIVKLSLCNFNPKILEKNKKFIDNLKNVRKIH